MILQTQLIITTPLGIRIESIPVDHSELDTVLDEAKAFETSVNIKSNAAFIPTQTGIIAIPASQLENSILEFKIINTNVDDEDVLNIIDSCLEQIYA